MEQVVSHFLPAMSMSTLRPVSKDKEQLEERAASSLSPTAYESTTSQIHEAVSAWFIGPQAENADLLKELFSQAVADHVAARTSYHPEDGNFITPQVKSSRVYEQTVNTLRQKSHNLSALLNEYSIPFYSPRYGAHMTFESSLPSIVGWLSGLLLNPNNVSFEAGPITTVLEHQVGQDLCKMIGFHNEGDMQSWAHLTCDGTVANIEFICAARNLKFYPFAILSAMKADGPLSFLSESFTLDLPSPTSSYHTTPTLLTSLTPWQLLNLPPSTILAIPDRILQEYGITSQYLESALSPFIVQNTGLFTHQMLEWGIKQSPKMLVAATKHYSWPKGVALTGIGTENLLNIPVDTAARIDIDALRVTLDHCLHNHIPVYAVIAIIGSTEEGAVDPLVKIIKLREEYAAKGLSFLVHADAAWGGYFTSTLRDPPTDWVSRWPILNAGDRTPFDGPTSAEDSKPTQSASADTFPPTESATAAETPPYMAMKHYTTHQLGALCQADSVTIDPHKSGYCPYPAGGLCYRDRRIRHLLTWSAPYIEHGKRSENIGVHGVEGSKPGAAAASVFMHHSVVGLHKRGHGGLLGEVSFTCARIAAHWATLSTPTTPFLLVPFNKLRFEPHPSGMLAEKEFIRSKILGRSNDDIIRDPDPEILAELRTLGSDLNINAFVCNFRMPSGSVTDITGHDGINAAAEAEQESGSADPSTNPKQKHPIAPYEPLSTSAGTLNSDICAANHLNALIFDALSINDVGQTPLSKHKPFFLSATILKHADYGECLTHFKKRAGLETESNADLFVLRNVVMSPFQANAEFVENVMGGVIRGLVEENVKVLISRNTISPQKHTFLMQGTDRLDNAWTDAPKANVAASITISHPRIVKQRSLLSRWHDPDYDTKHTPFYLYGTPQQQHIDHMLLKAPNAQLTAENVELEFFDAKSTKSSPSPNIQAQDFFSSTADLTNKLANGLLVYVQRPEKSMQPFGTDSTQRFFYPTAEHHIFICDDPFPATAHGPGLALAGSHKHPVIAKGKIKLPLNVFVDCSVLNREDFRDAERIYPQQHYQGSTAPTTSDTGHTDPHVGSAYIGAGDDKTPQMSWADKAGWRAMVKERLNINHEEYYTTGRQRQDGRFNDGRDISKHPVRDDEWQKNRDVGSFMEGNN
ncbi:PLP-dependent transferase [Coprinopsis marcescibilis]|uniref:PLP-dependent transferase n=1 Tax=Coprinopsis marcescibilis TaxID=230819 RepID=A0A5C3KJQ6_COPMA|nr:PLP-dependent transferase [Coprinopsis marcescibilis]